ncbi:MAG: molybdopterin-dependent oxidoreductase [Gammaproteobacteria bacterium]|nr:molybdopterin-dependent oxidoreductase [Gammaproteobacteria bacterium]
MAELPGSLRTTPELDAWIAVHDDGTITLRTGKVEIGQGILTAVRLIAAAELDVDPDRIVVTTAESGVTPNEFVTAGSMSIEQSGAAIRQACAWARRLMLEAAAKDLGVDAATLSVDNGEITGPGLNETATFWTVQGGRAFDFTITELTAEKPPNDQAASVQNRALRIDLLAKVRGEPVFVHDLSWPGMLHARVVRPPTYHYVLEALDLEMDDLVRDGSFVAVVDSDEYGAVELAARVSAAARWRKLRPIEVPARLSERLVGHESAALPLRDGVPTDESVRILQGTGTRLVAEYSRPFIMHGSLGPSAAGALYENGQLTVWSPSQGIELLRLSLARVLGLDPDDVTVIYVQGAGCYGHNGADDVSLDAALCARARPGRHVLLKWTREQEHCWEPYGPAMTIRMGAHLDDDGSVQTWTHDAYSFTHSGRPIPGRPGVDLVAAWHLPEPFERNVAKPSLAPEVGIHRNALPIYDFPDQEVVKRFVPDSPLRTSSLRSLGAQANVFAIESFMDELAHAAQMDPVSFRLRHLTNDRARDVLEAAVDLAGGMQGSRGIGLAQYKNRQTYAAVVVEVDVDMERAEIKLERMWIAADAGRVVDHDGLVNQLEGGAVQALSWCLKEEVRFDADGVQSVDWETYPILRFSEMPIVQTRILDRPEQASMGAGEATQGPASGALANAVFAASGLRVRNLPMTPARLRETAAT